MIKRLALKTIEYTAALAILGIGISLMELTLLGAFRERD